VSRQEEDNFAGKIHTNRIDWFPYPWVPADDGTAEFELQGYLENYGAFKKNITGSCLAKLGPALTLSGGTTSELPAPDEELATVEINDPFVARKSPGDTWNMEFIPNLIEGRENHACLGTQLYGNLVLIVAGGNMYELRDGTDGHDRYFYRRKTYETLASVEVLQASDNRWKSGPKLETGRLDFGLGEICGEVMAMGGRRYDGEYLSESHREGGVNGPVHWTHTVQDNIEETFLDTIETLEGISWMISEKKMPGQMASFGLAKAPLSLCKVCDNTLPDGTLCGEEDYVLVADPESCWKYYECDAGCVTLQTCPDDFKFDPAYWLCTFPRDVDCGDRPCNDDVHCPAPLTTKKPSCDNTLPDGTPCGEDN